MDSPAFAQRHSNIILWAIRPDVPAYNLYCASPYRVCPRSALPAWVPIYLCGGCFRSIHADEEPQNSVIWVDIVGGISAGSVGIYSFPGFHMVLFRSHFLDCAAVGYILGTQGEEAAHGGPVKHLVHPCFEDM